MENIWKQQIPAGAKLLICRLNKQNHQAYFVGGCVRDTLLDIKPNDWDLTTSASPDVVSFIFEDLRVIETGLKHGTVTVIVYKDQYEITTFRKENGYDDFRRPNSVEFVSDLKEDLSRRDFTINAMAMDAEGNIIDYFSGKDDLEQKIIKAVGNPEQRFSEDALRILRMYRFAAKLSFSIDEESLKYAVKLKSLLSHISKERIIIEMEGILKAKTPSPILNLMYKDEVLQEALDLKISDILKRENDVDFTDIDNLKQEEDYIVRLTFLYYKLFLKEKIQLVLKKMKYSNEIVKQVSEIIKIKNELFDVDLYKIRKIASMYNIENIEKAFVFNRILEKDKEKLENLEKSYEKFIYIQENNEIIKIKDLKINGNDIIDNNIASGENIGKILFYLLEKVLNNPLLNEKSILLDLANKYKI